MESIFMVNHDKWKHKFWTEFNLRKILWYIISIKKISISLLSIVLDSQMEFQQGLTVFNLQKEKEFVKKNFSFDIAITLSAILLLWKSIF